MFIKSANVLKNEAARRWCRGMGGVWWLTDRRVINSKPHLVIRPDDRTAPMPMYSPFMSPLLMLGGGLLPPPEAEEVDDESV